MLKTRFCFYLSLTGLIALIAWSYLRTTHHGYVDIYMTHAHAKTVAAIQRDIRPPLSPEADATIHIRENNGRPVMKLAANISPVAGEQLAQHLKGQGYTLQSVTTIGPEGGTGQGVSSETIWLGGLFLAAIASICFMLLFLAKRRQLLGLGQ